MAIARALFVTDHASGTYHCVSRCVRRAWLCGVDAYSGNDFSYRKAWVEQRLQHVAACFSIGIYGYAVMSNHLHLVVHVDVNAAQAWPAEEVAQRWCQLFPNRDQENESRIQRLLKQTECIELLRQRLCSLSWLMRCINEPIARAANREDGCTGRFWEGRFKCQVLADERAVLAAMAYVDLNPVRAGMTIRLDHSHHTSIQQRVLGCRKDASKMQQTLKPLLGFAPALSLNQGEYIALVQWTGQQVRPDKKGAIPIHAPSVLNKTGCQAKHWPTQVKAVGSAYWRMIGSTEQLMEKAEAIGQRWLKGIGIAKQIQKA
jgi:REP element-mobilizing transposase RayT